MWEGFQTALLAIWILEGSGTALDSHVVMHLPQLDSYSGKLTFCVSYRWNLEATLEKEVFLEYLVQVDL